MARIKIVCNYTPSNKVELALNISTMIIEGIDKAKILAQGYVIAGLNNQQKASLPPMQPLVVSVDEFEILPATFYESGAVDIQYRIVVTFDVPTEAQDGLLRRVNQK